MKTYKISVPADALIELTDPATALVFATVRAYNFTAHGSSGYDVDVSTHPSLNLRLLYWHPPGTQNEIPLPPTVHAIAFDLHAPPTPDEQDIMATALLAGFESNDYEVGVSVSDNEITIKFHDGRELIYTRKEVR